MSSPTAGSGFQLRSTAQRYNTAHRVSLASRFCNWPDRPDPAPTDSTCLRCHTTGYRQRGGFKPAGSKNKKGKDVSSAIDPSEPNKEQVGCEMCHSVVGGAQFRVVMKNSKGKFKKAETEQYGQRWDYANVCTRCHMHPRSPHKGEKFDYAAAKATTRRMSLITEEYIGVLSSMV